MGGKVILEKEIADPKDINLSDDRLNLFEALQDDLGRFTENGVSFINREIYLGEISQSAAVRFHKNLLILENLDDKPITIHINSNGGLVDAGWAIYDAIRFSKCKIYGVAWGVCASMATIILQACDKRVITEHCCFMLHEGTDQTVGEMKARDPISYGTETKRQLDLMYDVYEENSNLNRVQLEELIAMTDVFLTPLETIKCGFADTLLPAKKKVRETGEMDLKSFKKIVDKKAVRTIHKKGR